MSFAKYMEDNQDYFTENSWNRKQGMNNSSMDINRVLYYDRIIDIPNELDRRNQSIWKSRNK